MVVILPPLNFRVVLASSLPYAKPILAAAEPQANVSPAPCSLVRTFIAFFGAAAMLPRPVRYLSLTNAMIQRGIAAADVIFNQIDLKPEINDGSDEISDIRGDITFKNVSFSYSENEKILDDREKLKLLYKKN